MSAVAVAAGLGLGLGACAPAGGDGDGGGGGTTLTVWDPGLMTRSTDDGEVDAERSFLHQAAAAFEDENAGVEVEIVQTSGDITASSAQFQAASIAGNGPDIRIGYTGGNTLSYADFLLDLEGTFDQETVDDLTGWNTVRADYQEDGDLLALPFGGGSYFYVFYNKPMVEEAGIDLSTPPASWEALLDLGQQVQDTTDHNPFWVANQEGYVGAWTMAALVGGELGGTAFTDMFTGDVPLDDPAVVKAYDAYAQLFSRGLTNPDAGSIGNADLLSGFIQGNGAFFISGGWENDPLYEAMGEDVGVFPIPMLEGARFPNTVAGGPNLAASVTNYSEHQEVAKDFLRYLAEPETIDLYVELFQTEASNSASADSSVITNPYLQAQAEFLTQADNVVYPFDNVMPQQLIDLFYRLNGTVFTGQTSPQDAAAQLQAGYEESEAAN